MVRGSMLSQLSSALLWRSINACSVPGSFSASPGKAWQTGKILRFFCKKIYGNIWESARRPSQRAAGSASLHPASAKRVLDSPEHLCRLSRLCRGSSAWCICLQAQVDSCRAAFVAAQSSPPRQGRTSRPLRTVLPNRTRLPRRYRPSRSRSALNISALGTAILNARSLDGSPCSAATDLMRRPGTRRTDIVPMVLRSSVALFD